VREVCQCLNEILLIGIPERRDRLVDGDPVRNSQQPAPNRPVVIQPRPDRLDDGGSAEHLGSLLHGIEALEQGLRAALRYAKNAGCDPFGHRSCNLEARESLFDDLKIEGLGNETRRDVS
jgi:hypothetical protein